MYLLTAIGLTPGGSSTVHIYTQTVHRTTQNKQYIDEHNNLWEYNKIIVIVINIYNDWIDVFVILG